MGEVDPAFILPVEHRPKKGIEAEGIPLIDLSVLQHSSDSNPDALKRLVSEVGDASEKWGFFQVINHGVPLESLQNIELASKKFFALPKEEKMKVSRDEVSPMGYDDIEYGFNVRNWKEMFDFVVDDPTKVPVSVEPDDIEMKNLTNKWLHHPFELREACEKFAEEGVKLCLKLLEVICLSIGLPRNRMNGFFEEQISYIRLTNYPPCPTPDLAIGVEPHKDGNALTILYQDDVGGLDVKRQTDGEWVHVKPIPETLIVNIGDIMQVWTNDKYKSVEHQVRLNSEEARLSIPLFLGPSSSTWVEPLAELINERNPPKYKAYNWGKYYVTRKRSNYNQLKVEVPQLYHYEI